MKLKALLFTAGWCQPCRQVKPILQDLKDELVARYGVEYEEVDVDGDEGGRLAVRYDVKSVPCVVMIRDGEVIDMIYGVKSKEFYRKAVERALST